MKTLTKSLKSQVLIGLALGALLVGSQALAANSGQADYASNSTPETVSYKITDGYGEYSGYGATKNQAAGNARTACIMQKVAAYENRFGVTPDEDTADMFIDACINR